MTDIELCTVYAWGRTARLICESSLYKAFVNTDGHFAAVDLCSAYPIWPQIIRERHREDCRKQASGLAGDCVVSLHAKTSLLPYVSQLDDSTRKSIRDKVTPKNSLVRRLLQSVIQKVLYEPPLFQSNNPQDQQAELAGNLTMMFNSPGMLFTKAFELEKYKGRGRWQILLEQEAGTSFTNELKPFFGSNNVDITAVFAGFLSGRLLPLFRRYSAVSLDIEDPKKLLFNAEYSFPPRFRDTVFFKRAGKFKGHIQADVMVLPFKDNSISFYSSIEGYPFYLGDLPFEPNHKLFVEAIARTLKPGGIALFCPWSTKYGKMADNLLLETIEEHWKQQGLIVNSTEYTLDWLLGQMRDRELALTETSPLFKGECQGELTVLIVEKPKL